MSHKLFVFFSIIVGCIQLFYSKLLNHEFLGTLVGLQHKTHYYLIAQNQDANTDPEKKDSGDAFNVFVLTRAGLKAYKPNNI